MSETDDLMLMDELPATVLAELNRRIDSCIAMLDEFYPVWVTYVDPPKLNMNEPEGPCGCLMAQIEGRYTAGLRLLSRLLGMDRDDEPTLAERYALDLDQDWDVVTYRHLTAAWKLRLARRLAG